MNQKEIRENFKRLELEINNNNPIREREREREREQNLLSYFQKNSISSMRLDNNKLLIKYNHKAEEELDTIISNSLELQQIKDYLENIPNKTITKSELESKTKQDSSNSDNPSDKTGLYVGLGIGGVILILSIFILVRKTRKRPT